MKQKTLGLTSIWLLCFILIIPVTGFFLDQRIALGGVTTTTDMAPLSTRDILDGSAQRNFGDWLQENIPGRKALIKFRNQIMYSLCQSSPNNNVIIGKDDNLFEYAYIDNYIGINHRVDAERISEQIDKLETLNNLLEQSGKAMYVFITPSKARFCHDKIPDKYAKAGKTEIYGADYSLFTQLVAKTDLKVFDSVQYIQDHRDDSDVPLYYASGIHWSNVWGSIVASRFCDYIRETSKYDLDVITVSSERSDDILYPDADLYDSCNLIFPPREEYYIPIYTKAIEGSDKPNVFCRGDSFMGQSLSALIKQGVFGDNVHFENNFYFTENYSTMQMLSSTTAYDEVGTDLLDYLRNTDILIFEANEINLDGIGYGFVDYLLDNPHLLV